MSWLNLASWIPCTEVEGPGKRAALWVQGCDKRCVGCCNPSYLKIVQRNILSADTMIECLLAAHQQWDLEGVTFLGGEPFLQAQGLAAVAEGVSRTGLSVMTFTGYTMQELHEMSLPGTHELLAWTDVLVDGPYESLSPDSRRNWVGSTNQRFHYLTNRYDASIEGAGIPEREVEWRIRDDGHLVVNGWPCSIK
ncbi:4Fe-4S single cluster domain-containing protein [Pseudogulbenkiania subflava]|uniref:Anaerobic ribonucleoside-triphosphate reductase-activating protein n=1 Tax=Pseudogulbenkiania subflava DSM 22618 TaxID=1123014 RepID=A0A1Y6CA11_9NEIS|nr:anaerobic ribonucleoside-triphosphate reductase activating protein [Pseudogulbenkiania subflava DSM 22618]